MPYITYVPKRKAKYVISLLRQKGLLVQETEMPEYIITIRNPKRHLPPEIVSQIRVEMTTESYVRFLKDAGKAGELLRRSKLIGPGDIVKVIKGEYEGFTGIVRSKDDERDLFRVEISVFGRLISETFEGDQLERVESGL